MRYLGALAIFCLLLAETSAQATIKMRGAAMGGWLLMEKFISTSVMASNDSRIIDEWTFGLYATSQQRAALRDYWANYYTEADFQRMREAGLTHTRIALGFWHLCTQPELDLQEEPYITGGWELGLVPTLARMKRQGMKAILDLHGLPGSQNGYDNSGRAGEIGWGMGDTLNRTYELLERIEPINEAACWGVSGPVPLTTLQEYLYNAYDIVRFYLPASKYMFVVEQAFLYDQWIGFMPEPQYENVWMDAHIYQAFSPGLYNVSYLAHFSVTCVDQQALVEKFTLPTFIGEWSLGFKMGSWDSEKEEYPTAAQQWFLRAWFLYQVDVWENSNNAQGWFFWTWKTASAPYWDYTTGLTGGWIPTQVNDSVVAAGACRAASFTTGVTTSQITTYSPTSGTSTSSASIGTDTSTSTVSTTSAGIDTAAATTIRPLVIMLCIVFTLVI